MKNFISVFFVLIGLASLIAGISIILQTVVLFIMALIAKNVIGAVFWGLLWFIEMFVMNYVVNYYHGEE